MAKKDKNETFISLAELEKGLKKFLQRTENTFEITQALLKDGFCNYHYMITKGVGAGDKHKVDGSGIAKDTMYTAYSKLNVHLAYIDDAFKRSDIDIENIDKFHTHEITQVYNVTGFKTKGDGFILIGSKYVECGHGRMEMETPKVSIDDLSSYQWHNELKTAIEAVREEVAMYKEGNYTPVKMEEDEDPKQLAIDIKAGADNSNDDFFENKKV